MRRLIRLYREGLIGLAVKGEIGRKISWIGEKLGIQNLKINNYTLASWHRSGIERSPVTVKGILYLYPDLHKIIDLGCCTACFVNEFLKHGIYAEGYEYLDKARKIASDSFGIKVKPLDLNTFGIHYGNFDACICFEVAHYLTATMGDKLVKICAGSAPLVFFSSAHPKQGGYGHINEQSRQYWIERFCHFGFGFSESKTEWLKEYLLMHLVRGKWFSENICVFEKLKAISMG
jgi:hypothetical protein